MQSKLNFLLGAALSFGALLPAALAQAPAVEIKSPWVRSTVPGQKVGAGYVTLSSPAGARLVGASTPASQRVELHEMAIVDNVMRMREVPAIAIPAGQTVHLEPGGLHLMLMDLKAPLKAGDKIKIELRFEGADSKRSTQTIEAEVRELPAGHGQMKKGH